MACRSDCKHCQKISSRFEEYQDSNKIDLSHLSSQPITSACLAKLIQALENKPTIQIVKLGQNGIKDENAEIIGNWLINNETVKELNLESNDIKLDGIKALSKSLKQNRTIEKT
eukprot:Pgem_evm1s8646